jgi:lysozyme
MLVTTAEANALFDKALEKFEDAVNRVKWPINQSQFDALVSLTYNIGISAFLSSTLLRYLNQGNVLEASNQFLAWCKINGQRCPGLLTRREKERELFLKGA